MEEQVVKLGDIIRASIKKWKLILLCTIVFAAAAGVFGAFSKEEMKYEGTAKIFIDNTAEILDNGLQVKKDDKLITNYIELMKTRDFVKNVANGLDKKYEVTPEIIQDKTKITNIPGSDFIQIVYTSSSQNETVDVIDGIITQFKEASKEFSPETEYSIGDNIAIKQQMNIRNKKMLLAIGIVGGFIVGCAAAFIYECINRRFRTKGEIERVLKMDVIGTIPAVNGSVAKNMATSQKTNDIVDEAYNGIATSIKYSKSKGERCILVTSSVLGEGSSTTASRVALSLAAGNNNVVVIDANLRNDGISAHYNKQDAAGLAEVVSGKADLKEAVYSVAENLSLLPSGKTEKNPVSVIDSKEMDSIIDELKSQYDYVIIDAAPVKVASDAVILSTKADGTIIIVRADKAKYDTVKETVTTFKSVGAKITGIVFNGADTFVNKFYRY